MAGAGVAAGPPEERAWWASPAFVALAIAFSTVPLLYPPIPPLVDLLGHMARFRIELDQSPWLQQYYGYAWAPIGNLGVDLLVRLLAPVLGIEPATKLVIVAIPGLTVAGLLWVAREVHGRIPPTAYFAIPFVYGHPFLYGFVNFALAMALAFFAFALWLRLGRLGKTRLRAVLFVPISLIFFFAHAFGWGVLGLLCFTAEAARLKEQGASWPHAVAQAALAASVMALPIAIMPVWRSGTHGTGIEGWFDFQAKLVWIKTALRDRWQWFDIVSVLAAILFLIVAVRSPRLSFARELAISGLILLAVFLIMPILIFASAYADMRLVPYIFAILLIAIRVAPDAPRAHAATLAILAMMFVVVRLTANTVSFAIAAGDQRAKAAAVEHIPDGARVATFVQMACDAPWALPRNIHLGSLVVIRRQGFSNDLWHTEALNLMDIKYRAPGYYSTDPSQFVLPHGCNDGLHRTIGQSLAKLPRQAFDYVWLVDPPTYDPRLTAGLDPVWQGAGTTLFRIRR